MKALHRPGVIFSRIAGHAHGFVGSFRRCGLWKCSAATPGLPPGGGVRASLVVQVIRNAAAPESVVQVLPQAVARRVPIISRQ